MLAWAAYSQNIDDGTIDPNDLINYLAAEGWDLIDENDLAKPQSANPIIPWGAYFGDGNYEGYFDNQNAQAYVATKGTTLAIVFRGSKSPLDLLANLTDQAQVQYYELLEPLVDSVMDYLGAHPEIDTLFVTGHSLGAAMAERFLAIEGVNIPEHVDVYSAVFGSTGANVPNESNDAAVPIENQYTQEIIYVRHSEDPWAHQGLVVPNTWSYEDKSDNILEVELTGVTEEHSIDLYKGTWERYTEAQLVGFADQDLSNVSTVVGNSAADVIDVSVSILENLLYGFDGDDVLIAGSGNDTLDGGTGEDNLAGGLGNDTYVVDSAGDVVIENEDAGIDTILTTLTYVLGPTLEILVIIGSDAVNGRGNGLANDLIGNDAANHLIGKGGDDLLTGNKGADVLKGGAGADTLYGNGGADTLKGGSGEDNLTGGGGKDIFIFNAKFDTGNIDVIFGFNHASDTISLDDDIFRKLATGSNHPLLASQYIENTTGEAADADDRIIYNTSTGDLYYDPDGTGSAAAIKFAVIDGAPISVDYTDFTVVT